MKCAVPVYDDAVNADFSIEAIFFEFAWHMFVRGGVS